jgi:hypothetical protein
MENADHEEFVSAEFEEGASDISPYEMNARKNFLSSLSPDSQLSGNDSKAKLMLEINKDLGSPEAIMPFDFADQDQDDFEFKVMQKEVHAAFNTDKITTVRKQSAFDVRQRVMEHIQRERVYSMEVEAI